MGVGDQWAGSGWVVGHYGGGDDENDGGSFHGGAVPVVDAAVDGGADVVDGGGASVGCVPLEAPCDLHGSPGDAQCGAVALGQGEPWGQGHQHSQSHPEHGHTAQDQEASYRD